MEGPGRVVRRPFIPRKEHTKSRGACLSCKRRKVKCSESRPSCELCSGKGFICEYPRPQKPQYAQKIPEPAILESYPLQAPPNSFIMSDLRLFHHFLLHASPHHPIGNETVWVQKIPALAHHYDFLMHAMLALAASNLTAISNADFSGAAISHRARAVRNLKDVLGTQISVASDADAMLATFYIFGFQALYIDDGLIDFLIMIRGCALVARQIQTKGHATVFQMPDLESYVRSMETEAADIPCMSTELAMAATVSLEVLKSFCALEVEFLILSMLENIVMQMQRSSIQACSEITALYATIAGLSTEDFLYFTNPAHTVMQIILGHFVAVHVIAGPLIVQEGCRSKKLLGRHKITKWLDSVVPNVGLKQLSLLEWPLTVVRTYVLLSMESYVEPLYDVDGLG